jgi:hypothetical protein
VIGLLRSALPMLFWSWGWATRPEVPFFVPWGVLFMGLGLLYGAVSLGLWSDNRLVVLTRRELAAYFYSPLAYLILAGMTIVAGFLFANFVERLAYPDPRRFAPVFEPIVQYFFLDWWPIICLIFIIPVLTMRLLSEEKRSGTLEVLLTAPVDEGVVVLSKYIACMILFLILWVPWGLFLVGLRIISGLPFDYQALMSFFIALTCIGAGFIGMGVFFSSLTRNQIASAVLTFAGLLGMSILYFVQRNMSKENAWKPILDTVSFVGLWGESLEGHLIPKLLVFHLSAAVFWLFLATKVLEARKWS